MPPDYNISASEDGHLSPAQRVEKWKDENTPLTDRQKIAHWMASTFLEEKELYHSEVVQHIFQKHGQHTDLIGTTDAGAYSIDDTILAHFQEPFGHTGPEWIHDRQNYEDSKWVFSN